MERALRAALCVGILLAISAIASGQEEPQAGEGEPGTEERLASRDRLIGEAKALQAARKLEEAVERLEELLSLEREIFGGADAEVVGTLRWIAQLLVSRGDHAGARVRLVEAADLVSELLGPDHWRTTDARLAVEDFDIRSKLTPGENLRLEQASFAASAAYRHYRAERNREAIAALEQGLTIRREVLGERHPLTAATMHNLALLLGRAGAFAKSEELHLRALDVKRKLYGEIHPEYVVSLGNYCRVLNELGEYREALHLLERTLEIRLELYGEEHEEVSQSLNDIALQHAELGEYGEAEPLYRRALEIAERTAGKESHAYGVTLNNLAEIYREMGELEKALELHLEALEIARKVHGEEGSSTLVTLGNLAMVYGELGRHEEAERLCLMVMETLRRTCGEDHPAFSRSVNNLAAHYHRTGQNEKALEFFTRALELDRKLLGDEHLSTAITLNNLAMVQRRTGRYEEAETCFREALAIREKALGDAHPDTASSLQDLAVLLTATGRAREAAPMLEKALSIMRRTLDASYAVLSERQQLKMSAQFRGTLDAYLSLPPESGARAGVVYENALGWKGAVFARQALARIPKEDPAVATLFREFESTSRRLATLLLSTPTPDRVEARLGKIRTLTVAREELERKLAMASESYRELRAADRRSIEELRNALPKKTILVDFLEFELVGPVGGDGAADRRISAFLVPAEGEVRRLELGSAAVIGRAVEDWRRSFEEGAGRKLRALVWEPVRVAIGDAKTILVSPEGPLNRLPFGVLPGEKPGTYVLERYAVAVVAVPRLLPGLLRDPRSGGEGERLLLVGDVDYGGAATDPDTRPRFPRLPATRAEAEVIRTSFAGDGGEDRTADLRGAGATEGAFREAAPGCRWLHIATHGFFAPAHGEKGARHPGLLSGLVFAGANSPPDAEGDDGILTALEVASLDLSGVEMAVLSACETGLGEVAGGEGVLGLQRAFQVSGARTTVASLWMVPDLATRRLMERFYENLWKKGMPKLEALRQAQLWLLNEGGGEQGVLRGLGGLEGTSREDTRGRLQPRYWGAFVLSGDWR